MRNDARLLDGMTPRPCCRALLPALNCNDTYYLPEGLPGFHQIKGFSVHCVPDIQPFFYIRSLEPESLSFVCIDPFLVYPAYEPELSEKDMAHLELTREHDAVFVTLVDMRTDSGHITTNLRGPLVLNKQRRLARQTDCANSSYPLRYPVEHAFRLPAAVHQPASSVVEAFSINPACADCNLLASA